MAIPALGQILLVDDERAIIDSCTIGLTRAGYDVDATTSPHDAIELAIRRPYDLLLVDMMMPGMTGIDLLSTIKHLYPDIASVMITGHGTMQIAIQALRAGATGFLLKPFTAADLRLSIEDALSKSRVLKENVWLQSLMPLHESSRAFHLEMSLERLTATVSEQIKRSIGADEVSVLLAGSGEDGEPFRECEVKDNVAVPATASLDVLSWVAQTREPLTIREGAPSNLPAGLSGLPHPGVVIYVPMLANGTLVAILRVKKAGIDQTFDDPELEILSIQASQAAIAIRNALLLRDVEEGYLDALAALANTLEARDADTRGHTERLSRNSVLIANRLGLSRDEVESARVGAMLHDIGKIGIADAILRKPGRLTPEEFAVMKQHPVIGDRILAPIPQMQKARGAVLHHHERFDGSGYPLGLTGAEIPIAARIVAVADSFDAVTATRVYHAGESVVHALEELTRGRGSHFDPEVVDAFFSIIQGARREQGARLYDR